MSGDVLKRLRAICSDLGVTLIERENGHLQIRGSLLVNYYPWSKNRTAYVAGTTKRVTHVDPETAVVMALNSPPVLGQATRRGRKNNAKRKRRMWKAGIRTCYVCKGKLGPMQITDPTAWDYATIEHKIPLKRGGLDHDNNRTLSHARCNSERGHDMPELELTEGESDA